MKIQMRYLIILLLSFLFLETSAQTFSITGIVQHEHKLISDATVDVVNTNHHAITNDDGSFTIDGMTAGVYQLKITAIGFITFIKKIEVIDKNVYVEINVSASINDLDSVTVQSQLNTKKGFIQLHDVEGTAIYAGKKTEVIVLKNIVANTATNNSRQIYSKVAGLNIWENDGAGLQLAIGGRGLSPNRISNFNTRQNGYDISADALGYPESYYTPPAEAVERIEIVRGAASLQYGTQFGGMINFKMNSANDTSAIHLNTRLTYGSWNFLNTSTSINGTINKFSYYAFYQHKSGDGWRPNAEFNSNTAYANASYNFNKQLRLTLEYTYMNYLEHQPGGLTDADFEKDARQSLRTRNWFKVEWNLQSLSLDYHINQNLTFNTRFFSLIANRYALGLLTNINRIDDGSDRSLYIDHYKNWGNETRLLYQYSILKMPATALVGFRYYSGHTHREQGFGNNGSTGTKDDFTFMPTLLSDSLRYSSYIFPNHNTALFAENIFRLTKQLHIIPGVRYENIVTKAEGNYTNVVFDLAGNPIDPKKIVDNKQNSRSFLLGGLGATYNFKSSQLYANFSQNYKAINFNDLRTLNPNLLVDSNLQDEKGYTADIGFRKSTGIFNYDVSLFLIHYNNKIGNILSADTINFLVYNLRTNVAKSRHYGIESYGELNFWKLLYPSSKTDFSLFTNFSVIKARYVDAKEAAINNNQVEFVPEVIFKTGLNFSCNKWQFSYQFSYTGKQYTDATNATFTANAIDGLIPSYYVMDLSAAYKFNKHFSLFGSVNNLSNSKYFTRRADSYPGPGIVPSDARSYYITAQVSL